jgi:hypothetical protein
MGKSEHNAGSAGHHPATPDIEPVCLFVIRRGLQPLIRRYVSYIIYIMLNTICGPDLHICGAELTPYCRLARC